MCQNQASHVGRTRMGDGRNCGELRNRTAAPASSQAGKGLKGDTHFAKAVRSSWLSDSTFQPPCRPGPLLILLRRPYPILSMLPILLSLLPFSRSILAVNSPLFLVSLNELARLCPLSTDQVSKVAPPNSSTRLPRRITSFFDR